MVRRAYLTAEYVDRIELPANGEQWIADTAQPGFGLRIWATPNGVGKAYSVRATSPEGISIRRSANPWDLSRRMWLPMEERYDFRNIGRYLPEARKWARDQLDTIRGKPTLRDEERSQRAKSARWGRNLTLQRAALAVLTNLSLARRSITYRDRLDKLFSIHVPDHIQLKRITRIKSVDIDTILSSEKLSPENLRILRPFLGRCVDMCREVKVWPHKSLRWYQFDPEFTYRNRTSEPKIDWSREQFRDFFGQWATERRWQQGLCLSLYFHTRIPLSQLMTARWDDFSDIGYQSRLYPDDPIMWRREWRHIDGEISWHSLTRRAQTIFQTILERHEQLGLDSDYLFPSRYGRSVSHIRSVDHVWRESLNRAGLGYLSPKLMRELYNAESLREIWLPEGRLFTPEEHDQLRPKRPKMSHTAISLPAPDGIER